MEVAVAQHIAVRQPVEALLRDFRELARYKRRRQLPFQPAFKHRKSIIIDPTAMHLGMDGTAHPGGRYYAPGSLPEFRQKVSSLDAFENNTCSSVEVYPFAGPGHRQAALVGQLQSDDFAVEGGRVEARAEQAQDRTVLPSEHLGLAALCDFLEIAFASHLGGRYYIPLKPDCV